MSENFNESKKYDLINRWKKTNSIIAGIFTLLILSIFPLYFHNYYFDIIKTKYMFYYITVTAFASIMLITAIAFLCIDARCFQFENIKELKRKFSLKSLRKSDFAMILFLSMVTISTFQSEYIYESFWGNEGRFMGLFMMLLYGVSFFLISHCLIFRQWYLDAFLASGMIVCFIGIMQYFMFDPIGFKTNLEPGSYAAFSSTIGNINTYTSYIALVLGMSSVLATIEEGAWKRLWYLTCVVISLFALITGISDNAYLTLAVLFGLLPLYLFKKIGGIRKYMLLVSILFSLFKIIDFINHKYPKSVLKIYGLFNAIASYEKLIHIMMLLWGITIMLYVLEALRKKRGDKCVKKSNIGVWIWLVFCALLFIGIIYILYDANIAGNASNYGSLGKYIVFNDDWGSKRGFAWRIAMESYMGFPIIHKVFGYGLETYGIITVGNYLEEMLSRYNLIFDSAHNEYLQYLVTIGIAGLFAYLNLIITSLREMIQVSQKRPLVLAIAFSIICYSAQALVNISVPIVAPIMMTLLMVGVAAAGKTE